MNPQVTIYDPDGRLLRDRIEEAVELLGITRPVRIKLDHSSPRGYSGMWTTYTGWDHEVMLNARLALEGPEPWESLRYSVWHELGHAQDYERRSEVSGVDMLTLMKADIETYYTPFYLGPAMFLQGDAFMERYYTIPMEHYAHTVGLENMNRPPLLLR